MAYAGPTPAQKTAHLYSKHQETAFEGGRSSNGNARRFPGGDETSEMLQS